MLVAHRAVRGATITDTLPPEVSRAAADVQFGGNFANVAYNPATGTALFTLFTPLPAGTTAQLSITVPVPGGHRPGHHRDQPGDDERHQRRACAVEPGDGHRAVRRRQWTVTKGRVTSAAQLDTPFTYRVGITLAAGGTQNINNARFVDTLAAGRAVRLGQRGGVFDPGATRSRWAVGTLVPNANNNVTTRGEVTVIFPSTTFQAGDTPINNVEAFGAPAGEPDQSLGRRSSP